MAYLFDSIMVGMCWYPEHWAESLQESGLKRMTENDVPAGGTL